jgi:ribonuclease H / adenosylcobalamin/alpha-ribazole phosphatase
MTSPLHRLFLIRHGETALNREMRYVGSWDGPLSEVGERQAEGLAGLPVAAVYTSPLARARETGSRIASRLGLALEPCPPLAEQSFGEWEGLTRAEVVARGDGERLAAWESDPNLPPPGGESLASVQARSLALVEALRAAHLDGGWLVLVSHVGPIKALLASALGGPLATARRMFLDPGTVCVIDWGTVPVIRLFNAHVPLDLAGARWIER